jgi:hypothetical protein
MKRLPVACAALLLCTATLVSAGAQDKVQLVRKAKAGDVARYGMTGTMSIDANGQAMTVEIRQNEKITVTAVAPNGDLTFETETEAADMTVNGQTMPSPAVGTKATLVTRPDGSLVSFTTASTTVDVDLGKRMHHATTPVYPGKAVGVGETWTRDVKADATTGAIASTFTCEVLAFEKAEGVDTVKVKMTYLEADSAAGLKSTGTYWIDRTTGDQVKAEVTVANLPLGQSGMVGSITLRQARLAAGGL